MNKIIIIDTNTLMAIVEFKINIFAELERICDFPYTVVVLQGTIDELEKIQLEQSLKYKRATKLVLALLKSQQVKVILERGNVDNLLVQHSQQGDLVLTLDQELKHNLSKPYLTIRQKKKIILIE